MEVLTIIFIILGAFFALAQVIACIAGFVERINTSNPEGYLRMNANDVYAIFWYAWITGWTMGHRFCGRYDGDYKSGRNERRLEFADRRMNK